MLPDHCSKPQCIHTTTLERQLLDTKLKVIQAVPGTTMRLNGVEALHSELIWLQKETKFQKIDR